MQVSHPLWIVGFMSWGRLIIRTNNKFQPVLTMPWEHMFRSFIYINSFNLHSNKLRHVHVCLEKAMAPHSSTLTWKIPWTEEPGRLQSMGSLRVGHDWAISLSLFTFMHWRQKWQPTPVFLPGESQGRGARWAAVYGVAQSRTQLKRLSSSSILPQTPMDRMA